jgi:Universal stress protein family
MKTEIIPATLAKNYKRASATTAATDMRQSRSKKILAPTDFSPASEEGLKYALRFAREFGAEVTRRSNAASHSRTNRAVNV